MLISVSDDDPRPIYRQIVGQVKEQIRTGGLRPGDELPSVRDVARSLDINLHTVRHAYRELAEAGIIYPRLGRRATVAPLPDRPADRETIELRLASRLRELATEAFHLGVPPDDFRRLVDGVLSRYEEGDGR